PMVQQLSHVAQLSTLVPSASPFPQSQSSSQTPTPAPLPVYQPSAPPSHYCTEDLPPAKHQRTGYPTEVFGQNASEEDIIFGPCGHGPISHEDAKRIAFAALQMYGAKFKAADICNSMAIQSMPGFISIRFRDYAKAHLFVFSVTAKPPYPHQLVSFARTPTEYTDDPLSILQGALPTALITDPLSILGGGTAPQASMQDLTPKW
ncbi:hypothetical protein DXG01_003958, partial [Tephrocybe rancida]